VIAFDLPRHGKSIPPKGWWKEEYKLTAQFYADFVVALCRELKCQPGELLEWTKEGSG